jgi:hypothetical protein
MLTREHHLPEIMPPHSSIRDASRYPCSSASTLA